MNGQQLADLIVDQAARIVQQQEQISAALAIHARTSLGYCDYCWDVPNDGPKDYPCPTARALGVTA